MDVKYWVITGDVENWETALDGNIWGVRDKPRLKAQWDNMSKGDILFFYCKSPVGAVIGFGRCQAKFKQDKPLWPDEFRAKEVIYPYRWQFVPVFVLPKSEWRTNGISTGGDIKIPVFSGLNSVKNRDSISALNSKIKEQWKTEVIEIPVSEFLGKSVKHVSPGQHDRVKEILVNLGKISGFMVEDEYKMDGQRLDVIWKRIERGVPTFVFEVQIGGNVTEALGKLKHAFDLWNSNLYIVIEDKDNTKVDNLLSGTFHEIKGKLTVILVSEIEKFYELKVAEAKLGEKLNLL